MNGSDGGAKRRTLLENAESMSTEELLGALFEAIRNRADALPPAEALRFLFGLDASIYNLEGIKSVEYGGGLHTKHRHIRYHDFFVARIRPEESVLDLGCGNGALSFDIAEKSGAHVLGIDLSEENIKLASGRFSHPRIEYHVGDVLKNLGDRTFDVVVLSNVLEHLPDRSEFLTRVRSVTKPNRFLFRVPLFEREWRVPLKKELGVEWRLDATHETEYTLESFEAELTAAGLSITEREVRWGEIWAEAHPKN